MKGRFIVVIAVMAVLLLAGTSMAVQKKLTDMEKLGEYLYTEKKLSVNQNQSCATCHFKSVGFCDKENVKDPVTFPVSDGSDPTLFGARNAPPASYAGFSPKFHWDDGEGLFFGGLFWDGRASGISPTATGSLGDGPTDDPLADQAKGPFLNPVEMAMADETAVVDVVRTAGYAKLFEQVFPGTLNDTPVAYNNIAIAIAAFERSFMLNQFSSKFDKFVQEQGGDVSNFGVEIDQATGFRMYVGPPAGFKSQYFSYDEADGLALFNADSYTQLGLPVGGANGGMCYACHLTENHVTGPNSVLLPGQTYPPLFTDFSYDNLGIPVNPQIATLGGSQPPDPGLGGQEDILVAAYVAAMGVDPPATILAEQQGKFRVSTLRNIIETPPYGHNGYFATLEEIVHFYNTRDVDGWPIAEVPETVNNTELGNLGLTPEQEAKIVLFLKTLTDGNTTP